MSISDSLDRLPSLRPGINHVEMDGRIDGAVQSLVLNQMIVFGGEAVWIDSGGNAATTVLNRIAPNEHFMERIRVARAFTAHQHSSLMQKLLYHVNRNTVLVTIPTIDHFYTHDDLSEQEAEKMLRYALDRVDDLIGRYHVPVLITSNGRYTDLITDHADKEITCTMTGEGPRFESGNFKTLFYPGNGYIQTTLDLFRVMLRKTYLEQEEDEMEAV